MKTLANKDKNENESVRDGEILGAVTGRFEEHEATENNENNEPTEIKEEQTHTPAKESSASNGAKYMYVADEERDEL